MDAFTTDQQDTPPCRRNGSRLIIPGLDISVRSQGQFIRSWHKVKLTSGLNFRGAGIVLHEPALQVSQNVDLCITYLNVSYFTKGVVGYYSEKDEQFHYGIVFMQVPAALTHLIQQLSQKETTDKSKERDVTFTSLDLRRSSLRYQVTNLELRAHRIGAIHLSRLVPCYIVNICRGGMGFITSPLGDQRHQTVKLELIYVDNIYHVSGIVTRYRKDQDGDFYGIEFLQIPDEFARLLTYFENIRQLADRYIN